MEEKKKKKDLVIPATIPIFPKRKLYLMQIVT